VEGTSGEGVFLASYVEVNNRAITIRNENRLRRNMESRLSRRRSITRFSVGSQKRLARLLLNNLKRFKLFFTVTYRMNQRNCRVSKQHINNFLTRFRQAFGKESGYVWVLEFQKRGAVHFHIWFEEFDPLELAGARNIVVRKQIANRFKGDDTNFSRFQLLTSLWLRITGQLGDSKAVRASTDLKVIESTGFVITYAVKYAWKGEQKEYTGNIDEVTGEVLDLWVGRYWGASRSIRNEKLYASTNIQAVRIFRKWMKKQLGKKRFSGTWLLLNQGLQNRVMTLCDDLDRAEIPWEIQEHRARAGWRRNDPYRYLAGWRDKHGKRVREVDENWARANARKELQETDAEKSG
jgi:hypothetical protein